MTFSKNQKTLIVIVASIVAIVGVFKFVSKERYVKLEVEAKFDKSLKKNDFSIFDDTSNIRKYCKDSVVDVNLVDSIPFIVDDNMAIYYYAVSSINSYILKDPKDSTCCIGPVIPKGTIIKLQSNSCRHGLNPFEYQGKKIWVFNHDVKYLSGDENMEYDKVVSSK